ncbi:MAG TPA: hypothetical protein DCK83_00385 [Gallionellaceae bacterium]|nr:hypothetical protein [Gallionellaceae bacterium]
MTDIPENEPLSLRSGDTWKWKRTLADYPAGTWTLKYRFKHPTAAGFEVVATADGTDHLATVAAATSAGYAAGAYSWIAWVEGGSSEKYTVDTGTLTIDPDYRSGTAAAVLDDRSHAQKMLTAIETWLESRDVAVGEYEIAGRRMKYIPIAELIKLRNRYKNEVASAANAAAIAKGEGIGRKIQFRV